MTFLLSRGKTNGLLKFQSYLVSGFGVIAIDKKSKTSELYSAYTKNIYRCSFNQSSLECNRLQSWDLCHSIHHELGHSSRYNF